jgi:hypothetical protein
MGTTSMSETPRRRGRPKGTGIDDNATLQAISSLLTADALLKPTTAIRRAGITDPSVVRRLREKLKRPPPAAIQATTARQTPVATGTLSRDTEKHATIQPILPQNSRPAAKASPKTGRDQPPQPQDTAPPASTQPETAQAPRGMPSQPSQQQGPGTSASSPAPEPPPQPPDPQLEALRLSAEAAAAMSRLYLHCINHVAQTSPLSLALSSQAMMSKWFAGLMSAQIAAQQRTKP